MPSETLSIPGIIPNVFFLPGPSSTTVLFSSDSVTTTNSVPLAPIDPVGILTSKLSGFFLLISPVTTLIVPIFMFETILPILETGS